MTDAIEIKVNWTELSGLFILLKPLFESYIFYWFIYDFIYDTILFYKL